MCGQCGGYLQNGRGTHSDNMAFAHSNKNEKTTELIIAEIRARLAWIGVDFLDESKTNDERARIEEKTVRLLDYGCGTGTISRALAPYVTHAVGIDISPAMVHEYNTWSKTQTTTSNISGFVGNFVDAADPFPTAFEGEDFYNFDLAVVGLGFHHSEDPVFAAKKLGERLKKGGVLVILDFLVPEKSGGDGEAGGHCHGHGMGQTHEDRKDGEVAKKGKRSGFGEKEMKMVFENACVGMDFGFEVIAKGAIFETGKHSMTKDVFMARGTKV